MVTLTYDLGISEATCWFSPSKCGYWLIWTTQKRPAQAPRALNRQPRRPPAIPGGPAKQERSAETEASGPHTAAPRGTGLVPGTRPFPLYQPGTELAGIQPAGPRRGPGHAPSPARTGEVPLDRQLQPGRVLHDPRRRDQGTDPRRRGGPVPGRPPPRPPDPEDPPAGLRDADEMSRSFWNELHPQLASAGIHLLGMTRSPPRNGRSSAAYFAREIFPVLTPLAFDPGHPFPVYLQPQPEPGGGGQQREGRRTFRPGEGPGRAAAACRDPRTVRRTPPPRGSSGWKT